MFLHTAIFLPYAESVISHEGFSVNRLLSRVMVYRVSSSDERFSIARRAFVHRPTSVCPSPDERLSIARRTFVHRPTSVWLIAR